MPLLYRTAQEPKYVSHSWLTKNKHLISRIDVVQEGDREASIIALVSDEHLYEEKCGSWYFGLKDLYLRKSLKGIPLRVNGADVGLVGSQEHINLIDEASPGEPSMGMAPRGIPYVPYRWMPAYLKSRIDQAWRRSSANPPYDRPDAWMFPLHPSGKLKGFTIEPMWKDEDELYRRLLFAFPWLESIIRR